MLYTLWSRYPQLTAQVPKGRNALVRTLQPGTINSRESRGDFRVFCLEGLTARDGAPHTDEQKKKEFRRGFLASGFLGYAAGAGRSSVRGGGVAGVNALRAGVGDLCRDTAGGEHCADRAAIGSGGHCAQPLRL